MITLLMEKMQLYGKESVDSTLATAALKMVQPQLKLISELSSGAHPGVLSIPPWLYNVD